MRYLVPALLFISSFCLAQTSDYRTYYKNAIDAYKSKSYPKFYELIREANALHPYHQGILYQLGLAAALTGHKSEAIDNLKKAILIDNSFHLDGLPDFNAIKNTPEFIALLDLQKKLARPVIHSDTAFVIKDRRLHTEGIAIDKNKKNFYFGSIHLRKIVVRTPDGKVADFCPPAFEGMTSIFGLKVDEKKNVLWACSSPMKEMENFDSTARSGVFKLDLTTGKLLEKIVRPSYEKDGVFGDLILSKKGDVYVSDSQTNTIFFVNQEKHQLVPWFTSGDLWNMQGLTFSEDEKYLFISDYIKGIFRIDVKTKSLTPIQSPAGESLKGIDGLNYYKNSLIAIQNGVNPLRVMRYFLNKDSDAIIQSEVVDSNHPAFNEPTMGAIDAGTFYYIANSQWSGYDTQHHLKPDNLLQDIVVLKAKLE